MSEDRWAAGFAGTGDTRNTGIDEDAVIHAISPREQWIRETTRRIRGEEDPIYPHPTRVLRP